MNYLYNGVDLQDINAVWTDKSARPYASVVQYTDGTYVLILSDKSLGYRNGVYFSITDTSTTADFWIYDGSKWGFGATQTHGGYALEGYSFIWASYPVPNINAAGQEDGTIHLEMSDSNPDDTDPEDPTPDDPTPDLPTLNTTKKLSAMLSGFQLGQAVRRMRGMIPPPQ